MADLVAKIKLKDGSELAIGKTFINSLNSVSQSTTDAGSVHYGILANSGIMEIQDGNNYISDLVDNGSLPISDLDVKVEVDGKVIQEHITTDSDYNTEDNIFNVSMSNFIKDFDILKYKGYPYPETSKTLYDLFYDILKSYYVPQYPNETYPAFIDNMFESSILTYIKAITIDYPVIEYGKTYRKILDELCTIAQLNMFADANNKPKFISARPVYNSTEQINELKWKNIVDSIKYAKTLKNKFDGVEISETNINDLIDYNTAIYPASIDLSLKSESDFTEYNKSSQNVVERSQFVSSATFYYEIASYISSRYFTYSGTITIPKKSDDRLNIIKNINDNLLRGDKFAYTLTYNKFSGNASADSVWSRSNNSITVSNIQYGSQNFDGVTQEFGVVDDISSYTYTLPDSNVATSTSSTNPNSPLISFSEDSDNYYVVFSICVEKKVVKLGGSGRWTAVSTSSIDIPLTGSFENYIPLKLEFTIYGYKRTITFDQISASTEGIENCKTKASVDSSDLLQTTTKYNKEKISSVIKSNILNDYRRGISDGSLSLNENLYNIGDLVKYPDDKRVWRIVNKSFKYDGGYYYPIDVMQCLMKPSGYGLYDDDGYLIYDWNDLLETGLISVTGTVLNSVNEDLAGNMKIPNNITSLGVDSFEYCIKIKSVVIPDSVTSIGNSAFTRCRALNNILIPDSVTTIGERAFSGCTAFTEITLNSNITEIKNRMFDGCNNLQTVNFEGIITKIEVNAFRDCEKLIINIPSSVNVIGDSAFYNCQSLTSVTIPSGVTTISNWTFASCSKLSSVTLHNNITEIKKGAFAGTVALKSISLPTGIGWLSESVFSGSGLTSITIPSNITSIWWDAFAGCYDLSSAVFNSPNKWYLDGRYQEGYLDLSNPSTNAEYLRETYASLQWIQDV